MPRKQQVEKLGTARFGRAGRRLVNAEGESMFLIRLVLWMLVIGAGRSALLAQQHGENDYQAMVIALIACFALLALRSRRRRS